MLVRDSKVMPLQLLQSDKSPILGSLTISPVFHVSGVCSLPRPSCFANSNDVWFIVIKFLHHLSKLAGLVQCLYIPTCYSGPPLWFQGIHHRGASSLLGLAVIRHQSSVMVCFTPVATNVLFSGFRFHNKVFFTRWGCRPHARPTSFIQAWDRQESSERRAPGGVYYVPTFGIN